MLKFVDRAFKLDDFQTYFLSGRYNTPHNATGTGLFATTLPTYQIVGGFTYLIPLSTCLYGTTQKLPESLSFADSTHIAYTSKSFAR